MNKTCAQCGENKPVLAFSDRQRTKKFGKCIDCLLPKYTTQKYLESGDTTKCGNCRLELDPDFKQLYGGLCERCSWQKDQERLNQLRRAEAAQKTEARFIKRKKNREELEEKGVLFLSQEGVKRVYNNGRLQFGADD